MSLLRKAEDRVVDSSSIERVRRSTIAILALALLPSLAFATDLAPEDYQAALIEANSQIAGLSTRAQQLAITVAQQAREIAKLKADAKPTPDHKDAPHP